MAHIADLYNNGRCGQLRTVENARGAYADLIRREAKNLRSAQIREAIKAARIACPRCALPVDSARCGNCHFFPVPLPSQSALESAIEGLPRDGMGSVSISRGPRRAASASPAPFASTVAEMKTTRAEAVRVGTPQDEGVAARMERLERILSNETEASASLLNRVAKLTRMVESCCLPTLNIPRPVQKISGNPTSNR